MLNNSGRFYGHSARAGIDDRHALAAGAFLKVPTAVSTNYITNSKGRSAVEEKALKIIINQIFI